MSVSVYFPLNPKQPLSLPMAEDDISSAYAFAGKVVKIALHRLDAARRVTVRYGSAPALAANSLPPARSCLLLACKSVPIVLVPVAIDHLPPFYDLRFTRGSALVHQFDDECARFQTEGKNCPGKIHLKTRRVAPARRKSSAFNLRSVTLSFSLAATGRRQSEAV